MKYPDKKTKDLANEIARGVGQYVGLMYAVESLDRAIKQLEAERDHILSILMKPLQPRKEQKT